MFFIFSTLWYKGPQTYLFILFLYPPKKVCFPKRNIGQSLYIDFFRLCIQLFVFVFFYCLLISVAVYNLVFVSHFSSNRLAFYEYSIKGLKTKVEINVRMDKKNDVCCISFLCRCIEKPAPEIDLTLLPLGWIQGPLAHLGGLRHTANLEILA